MKIIKIISLLLFFNFFSFSDTQDSFLGNIDKVRQEHPEVFNPGVFVVTKNGKKYYIYCGYSERYFKDELIENEQELWEEAEVDAKERLYTYFTKKNKSSVEITIKQYSSLFYWVKKKSFYFRNFIVLEDNLFIKLKKLELIDFETKKNQNNLDRKDNTKTNHFKKKPINKEITRRINLILLEAEEKFYAGSYYNSILKYIEFENEGGVLPKGSKRNKELAKLFYKLNKDKFNIKTLNQIGNLFYSEENFQKSYIYYKRQVDVFFKKDRWLKNVPVEVLYNYADSVLELNMPLKAKNLFKSIKQFYPTSEYWKYAEEKMNNL